MLHVEVIIVDVLCYADLMVECSLCHESILKCNITTHEANCHKLHSKSNTSAEEVTQDTVSIAAGNTQRPGPDDGGGVADQKSLKCSSEPPLSQKTEATKKRKSKPKKKAQQGPEAEEDLDSLLAAMKQADSTCSHPKCKKQVNVLGMRCRFCQRKYCVEHSIPEVHGCAEEAKKHARSVQVKPGLCACANLGHALLINYEPLINESLNKHGPKYSLSHRAIVLII